LLDFAGAIGVFVAWLKRGAERSAAKLYSI